VVYPVSQRFLDTIPKHHQLITTCTVTPYGGSPTTFRVTSGSVTADRSQRIRRAATLVVEGGTTLYGLLSTPGARVAIDHGFAWSGTDRELVPMIRAELTSAALPLGSGTIQISVADYWQRIAAADFVDPYSPDPDATRQAEIIAAVTDALPGVVVNSSASDTGTVGAAQAWTSRADMINSFATDGGMEAYFAGDGTFILRDLPQISDSVAYLIKTGAGGTLDTLTRTRPLDRLYNTVILTPATADAAQTWSQVIAQITDTTNPRHPDRIGVRPYRYSAPTLLAEADAVTVAEQLLTKVTGTTETLTLDSLAHPGLEPGDIVRALTPLDGGADIVNHFLEQCAWDLATGAMNANTRNDVEVIA
jgi:hypothetical protein